MTRPFAPAADRNRDPILEVLRDVLPIRGQVLEIASGTGQHAVHLAEALPGLQWQPTDADLACLPGIEAWRDASALPNVLPGRVLDVHDDPWAIGPVDAVVCINMIHISPWSATLSLFRGAAEVLVPGGVLYLYGPYLVAGETTAPSNIAFDANLRARNPAWGIRALERVCEAADAQGLRFERRVPMPANNLSVVLRKPTE